MGISSDAILVYGSVLVEYDDFDGSYNEVSDIDEHIQSEPDDLILKDGVKHFGFEKTSIYGFEVRQQHPIEFEIFCSFDFPMWIVAYKSLKYRAYRGDYVDVGTTDVPTDADKEIKEFCKRNNLIIDKDPRWLLVSLYG